MEILSLDFARAVPITGFESRGAFQVRLGEGSGQAHAYAIHLDPGGEIGPHPAGFGQLFIVISGEGWVSGADGRRRPIHTGQAAHIARGEVHSKGSEVGCSAIMLQVTDFTPAP